MISKELENKAIAFLEAVEAEARSTGYNEGYAAGKAEESTSGPESSPVDRPYNSEAAKSNLLAFKGKNEFVFGIMDVCGNVYSGDGWKKAGKPEVLGIAYTNGQLFLCMHVNRIASGTFGGDNANFGSKVYTTTVQWPSSSKKVVSAYHDYSGPSNTEGIIEGCSDSLAAKCANVVFGNGKHGYMPACGELRTYCRSFTEVDTLIKLVGGDPLKTQSGAQLLHSSTCRNATTIWDVRYMKHGDAQPAYRSKTLACPTRIFVEL